MSKRLAILVIHGIGSQGPNFAEDMIEEISDRISDLGFNNSEVEWKSIYWADILESKQRKYLRKTKLKNDLNYIRIRTNVISSLGDASAYQKVSSQHNTTYKKIHNRINEKIKELYEIDLDKKLVPMLILAHSLGGHIISNYIWDIQNSSTLNTSDFEQFLSLSGIITFGCNIPLFTFAFDKVIPIQFPPKQLDSDLKKKAKWLNYYDPDDVLGYPLKTINDEYNKVVDEDISINVGGVFSSWNPASHTEYWTDNSFTKPLSKYITKFLN